MTVKVLKISFVLILVFLVELVNSQDIKSVDVNNLRTEDIKKIESTIKDSGLTEQEAINLARQRGASEFQISELQKRLRESKTGSGDTGIITDGDFKSNLNDEVKFSERTNFPENTSRIFGSSLFNNKNLTFEPGQNIQTPKNYEIGIGDEIIINIWGNSQNNYQLEVTRNGNILIPDVGPVYIAGQKFTEAEKSIKQRLVSIYAGMGGTNPNTFAQINIGKLRSIRVHIAGEVEFPGTFTLSAASTVFNALYLSGGPNRIGSFRNIKVIRNNQIFQNIDIYKFLVNADPSENIMLQDDDILFVPTADIMVKVSGEFKRDGIFEMKENEPLADLIKFAGGFSENSDNSIIQIQRITPNGTRIIDIPNSGFNETYLVNGDSITNGKVKDEFKNRVFISGAVYQPGIYEWQNGLTLYDLIVKADSLKKDAYYYRGIISRENADLTKTNIAFELQSIINREKNILLQPEDSIIIKSHFELKENPVITVTGEVLSPGEFPYSENMTLKDAVFMADGFTEGADSTYIEVARRLSYSEASDLNNQLVHIYTFNLDRNLTVQPDDAAFLLQPFDRISVRRAPGFREPGQVTINGEVKYAGNYALSKRGLRISDLVNMAGGITSHAFLDGATFKRYNPILGAEDIAIDLRKIIFTPGSFEDIYLRDGDIMFIPEYIQTVKVSGKVQNPFSLTYTRGKSLHYYINQSGGYDTGALKRKVFVRYANGSTATKKGFIIKNYPDIKPGSEIVVPQKPEKVPGDTGRWLAIASTFSSIALAIAAIF
jgi:protein involved in polysaccharide export with SLBB domain